MPGKILIIDGVATNRIVLKVKMSAAQYAVETCATCAEADAILKTNPPDLILINLADRSENRYDFCKRLRERRRAANMALVAVGGADTSRARFAALDAGCDDVLPHPISDVLMLARVRSLLRRRFLVQEWEMRDGTSRALGFEEAAAPRLTPPQITVLSHDPKIAVGLVSRMQSALSQPVRLLAPVADLGLGAAGVRPDVVVIDGSSAETDESALFGMIAELRARDETRHSGQLLLLPAGRPDIAALALDLGADDLLFDGASDKEIGHRCKMLVRRKYEQDCLRDRVRSGLHAAVTDPLTGLFNRRYAEAHLRRIAEKAKSNGREFAVMLLDIDHFKAVNDTFGHAAGDKVLAEMAHRLRKAFRGIDLIARIGGEEFLIAMPATNAREAAHAAERLRSTVGAAPFALLAGQTPIKVTVSVGVAIEAVDGQGPAPLDRLFARVDAALYAAKSSGRNTVSVCQAAA